MFTKTLAEQSNEEQLKLFYEPAKRFEIIGASRVLSAKRGLVAETSRSNRMLRPD